GDEAAPRIVESRHANSRPACRREWALGRGDAARGSRTLTGLVLDASVAAKWFLPADTEPLSDEAQRLLQLYTRAQVQLIVPDLFWPEFGNILWKAARQKRISVESAEEALTEMRRQRIGTRASGPLLNAAFSIAVSHDRAVYDAIY